MTAADKKRKAGRRVFPLERIVGPAAWRWKIEKLRGCEWRYSLSRTRPDAEPLFTRAAIDAAIAALRDAKSRHSSDPYFWDSIDNALDALTAVLPNAPAHRKTGHD